MRAVTTYEGEFLQGVCFKCGAKCELATLSDESSALVERVGLVLVPEARQKDGEVLLMTRLGFRVHECGDAA